MFSVKKAIEKLDSLKIEPHEEICKSQLRRILEAGQSEEVEERLARLECSVFGDDGVPQKGFDPVLHLSNKTINMEARLARLEEFKNKIEEYYRGIQKQIEPEKPELKMPNNYTEIDRRVAVTEEIDLMDCTDEASPESDNCDKPSKPSECGGCYPQELRSEVYNHLHKNWGSVEFKWKLRNSVMDIFDKYPCAEDCKREQSLAKKGSV